MARGIRNVDELLRILRIQPGDLTVKLRGQAETISDFPLRVPHSYVARMAMGDPQDPLLQQVLPLMCEHDDIIGFGTDPVDDIGAMTVPGVIHKYQGRALLVVTGSCAIHCRYCFRRHFPYGDTSMNTQRLNGAIDYLASNPSIKEVILSGGDPLSLTDWKLTRITQRLADITHLKRLRIHTRLPVVLPSRVDDGLIQWLESMPFKTTLVLHANHPNEIDNEVRHGLGRLAGSGITLLNQTVLLRGVNDNSPALIRLSESLFEANVLPYYLHLLDRVRGAAHFEVKEQEARNLHQELLSALPGYLVPRLVRELPGNPYKMPINPRQRP